MLVAQYLHLKAVPSVFSIVEYRIRQYRIFLRLRDCMFFLHVVLQLIYNSHRTYYVYFLEFDLTAYLQSPQYHSYRKRTTKTPNENKVQISDVVAVTPGITLNFVSARMQAAGQISDHVFRRKSAACIRNNTIISPKGFRVMNITVGWNALQFVHSAD